MVQIDNYIMYIGTSLSRQGSLSFRMRSHTLRGLVLQVNAGYGKFTLFVSVSTDLTLDM